MIGSKPCKMTDRRFEEYINPLIRGKGTINSFSNPHKFKFIVTQDVVWLLVPQIN